MKLSLTLPLPEEEADEEAEELTEMIEWGRLLLRLSDIIEPHTDCRNLGADNKKWKKCLLIQSLAVKIIYIVLHTFG